MEYQAEGMLLLGKILGLNFIYFFKDYKQHLVPRVVLLHNNTHIIIKI